MKISSLLIYLLFCSRKSSEDKGPCENQTDPGYNDDVENLRAYSLFEESNVNGYCSREDKQISQTLETIALKHQEIDKIVAQVI